MDSNDHGKPDTNDDSNPDMEVDLEHESEQESVQDIEKLTLQTRIVWGDIDIIKKALNLHENAEDIWEKQCFSKWTKLQTTELDAPLMHTFLTRQSDFTYDPEYDGIYYDVVGQGRPIRFGPKEFSCITGFTFGENSYVNDGSYKQFLRRLNFTGQLRISTLRSFLKAEDKKLKSDDVVRLCLLLMLYTIFLGVESDKVIEPVHLNLVTSLEKWNSYHWGVPIWRRLYNTMYNCLSKRSEKPRNGVPSSYYSANGFLFAFKIWIFECLPYMLQNKCRYIETIPRCFGWKQANGFRSVTVSKILMESMKEPYLPQSLRYTKSEESCVWFINTCKFLDDKLIQRFPKMKDEFTNNQTAFQHNLSNFQHLLSGLAPNQNNMTGFAMNTNAQTDFQPNLNQSNFEPSQSKFQADYDLNHGYDLNNVGYDLNNVGYDLNQGNCNSGFEAKQLEQATRGNFGFEAQADNSQKKNEFVNSLIQFPSINDIYDQLAKIIRHLDMHDQNSQKQYLDICKGIDRLRLNTNEDQTSHKKPKETTNEGKTSHTKPEEVKDVQADIKMDELDFDFSTPIVNDLDVVEVSPKPSPENKRPKRNRKLSRALITPYEAIRSGFQKKKKAKNGEREFSKELIKDLGKRKNFYIYTSIDSGIALDKDFWSVLVGETKNGWLHTIHLKLWIYIMLLERPSNSNWTILSPEWLLSLKDQKQFHPEFVNGKMPPFPTLESVEKFYIPINITHTHWLVVCIDMRNWTMTVYDSFRTFVAKDRDSLCDYLDANFPIWVASQGYDMGKTYREPPFQRIYPEKVPQQSPPLGDCGVWTCLFLERLTKEQPLFIEEEDTADAAMEFRWKFAAILYANKIREMDGPKKPKLDV